MDMPTHATFGRMSKALTAIRDLLKKGHDQAIEDLQRRSDSLAGRIANLHGRVSELETFGEVKIGKG